VNEKRVVITHHLYLSFSFDLMDEVFFEYLRDKLYVLNDDEN
jgi:hypothetical protein